jgi:hypothetical protein
MLTTGGFMTLGDWERFQQFLDILTPEPASSELDADIGSTEKIEDWPDLIGDSVVESGNIRAVSSSSVATVTQDSPTEDEDSNSAFLTDPDEEGATCTLRLYHQRSAEAFISFFFDPVLQGRQDLSIHEDYMILVLTESNIMEFYGRNSGDDDEDGDIE